MTLLVQVRKYGDVVWHEGPFVPVDDTYMVPDRPSPLPVQRTEDSRPRCLDASWLWLDDGEFLDHGKDPWYAIECIREITRAGIRFWAKCAKGE